MGEWHGDANWYGGQIQQIARIVELKGKGGYKIHLDHPEKRRSHRLARYLGSRRIIQLRVPDKLLPDEEKNVNQYLSQKFILCGRVFVPLHAKDNSAYLVETNEEWDGRKPTYWCGDQYRKSFAEIVAWHNPLDLNNKQVMWTNLLHELYLTCVPSQLANGPLGLPSSFLTLFRSSFLRKKTSSSPTTLVSRCVV